MNSLLKRQIKKYLDGVDADQISQFVEAIDRSYHNYDDQIELLQRAMKISSDELYEANTKLRDEAKNLKEVNSNFEKIFKSMNVEIQKYTDLKNFDSATYLKKQSQQIIKINKQREQLLQNLEQQNKSLNEYAHVVSHDLKAPLRSIDTLINWYIEDNKAIIDDQGMEHLKMILSNVEKMDFLIKGILDYSSIEQQAHEYRTLDLDELIQDVFRTIHIPQHIKVSQEGSFPVLKGDHIRFKQLFQNLIQNAIKYNDKQQGVVVVSSEEKEMEWLFYVKDNGMGIEKQYFEKIFTIFSKLENTDTASGIGLSIVKKIVDLYQGKIWLESTVSKGTTFYFTIPKKYGDT